MLQTLLMLRTHREPLIRDPYESPNRKLALEFNLQLSISDSQFNERLDQDAAERAKRHADGSRGSKVFSACWINNTRVVVMVVRFSHPL